MLREPPPPPAPAYLRRIVRLIGLTQQQLAEELGMGLRTVHRKLSGGADREFQLALERLADDLAPNWRTAAE